MSRERLFVYLADGRRMSVTADLDEFMDTWSRACNPGLFRSPKPLGIRADDGTPVTGIHPSHITAVASQEQVNKHGAVE